MMVQITSAVNLEPGRINPESCEIWKLQILKIHTKKAFILLIGYKSKGQEEREVNNQN